MNNITAIPDSLRNFDQLPNSAYVRLPTVCALKACSPATVWRLVRAGKMPAPKKVSEKNSAWNVGTLREHLKAEA